MGEGHLASFIAILVQDVTHKVPVNMLRRVTGIEQPFAALDDG